jgi:hypothetical protein
MGAGFMSVSLLVARTWLVSLLIIPFTISAMRRVIGGSKPQTTDVTVKQGIQPAE